MKALEEKRAYDKVRWARWRSENLEKARAASAKWKLANREKTRSYNAKWNAENHEKVQERTAALKAANPEQHKARYAKRAALCTDAYIEGLLKIKNAPPELIEMKRQQIFNHRLMKQLNEVIQQGIAQ